MIPSFDSFDWFSSLLPLLVVLIPVSVAVRRGGIRRVCFGLTGLYLLYLVAPRLALLHLVFWIAVAALQPLVSITAERRYGIAVLWASLAAALAPMIAWKVWPIDFVIDSNVWSNAVLRRSGDLIEAIDFTAPIVAPIGLSFSSFRAADLLIKSNLGLIDRLSAGRVFGYGLFPSLLVVGPIASYDEVSATLEGPRRLGTEQALTGGAQIMAGLFKVFVLAYLLSWSGDIFMFFADNTAWQVWLSLIAFTWFFYVNFAGYSDMAIGISTLLGGSVRPNFDSPFTRTNPTAFWNSWHMSLTRFLRVNVFTPMVGRHARRQYAATMTTMLLIGLWHSVTWASAIFGMYHGVSLIAHRVIKRRRPASPTRSWLVVKPIIVFGWFGASLPLLQLDLGDAIDFYGAMIGVS